MTIDRQPDYLRLVNALKTRVPGLDLRGVAVTLIHDAAYMRLDSMTADVIARMWPLVYSISQHYGATAQFQVTENEWVLTLRPALRQVQEERAA